MSGRLPALLALAFLLSLPAAAAEFGRESDDGYPINVNGEVLRPPVPPVLVDAALAGLDAAVPVNKPGPITVYPYYPLLVAELQRLAADHPGLVKLTSAGQSVAGLDIWMLEIADFARIDAGEGLPLEGREVVYIDGGTHSNEYSGVYFVTEVAQFLLDEYETNETSKWIVEHRHTYIVPMVNPDGSHVFGRLNAHTVNVNRNFNATWGTVDEDPVLNNPGPAPESEPETRVISGLFDTLKPDYVASIHCCGNLWLHPWGAEQIPASEDLAMFTRTCDEVFADVRDRCGPIWSTIYPASGTTTDEAYVRAGSAAWGFEMSGRGAVLLWGQPAIMDDVRMQERESWDGVLHAFLNVEKYGALPKVVAVEGDAGAMRVVVENAGWGNLTHGTLTLQGTTVPIPPLQPGERATLNVLGAYAQGVLGLGLDWAKRLRATPAGELPMGHAALDLPLAVQGARLVATLPGSEGLLQATGGATPAKVPAPDVVLVLGALGALGLAARRRREA
jgi:zinc carboxypeptidase